jgi:hypothetical protein
VGATALSYVVSLVDMESRQLIETVTDVKRHPRDDVGLGAAAARSLLASHGAG